MDSGPIKGARVQGVQGGYPLLARFAPSARFAPFGQVRQVRTLLTRLRTISPSHCRAVRNTRAGSGCAFSPTAPTRETQHEAGLESLRHRMACASFAPRPLA